MEDFLYAHNQPKQFGKYDLFLDGKITANEIVYKHITKYENGSKEIENIKLDDKIVELENRLETHFTFDNSYSTFQELEVAFANRKLKDTVIYIVKNENTSDNPDNNDMFNEYMIVGGKLELIGSGSYAKQQADLNKEIADRIADVDEEESRAKETEKDIITKLKKITGYEFDDVQFNEEDFTEFLNLCGGNIDSRIKEETTRAIEKEEELSEAIDTEKERAKSEEAKLEAKLDTEVTARINTVASITGYASSDDVNAKGGNIDTRIINIDATLNDKISSETTRAKEEEGKLSNRVTNLNTRIEALEELNLSSVIVLVNQLQSKITELDATIEELKAYHPVEEPTEPETPTEPTQ